MSGSKHKPGVGRRGDYEVGYGRPPNATKFKPGNRCNPRGRPKHKKTVGELMEEIMDAKVRMVVDGKPVTMTKQQVILHNLVNAAARGDNKSIITVFSLKARFQDSTETTINPGDLDVSDRSIIEAFLAKAAPVNVVPDPDPSTNRNGESGGSAEDTTSSSETQTGDDEGAEP